ncbi:MAG: hypothetical protein EPN86_06590 [Nanoarchaeota archaeon]|nr:MAG: hypothetical protein EPN86_06590 [Nanoarchaeota archaeon]
MISAPDLETILGDLLEGQQINQFSLNCILHSPNVSDTSIRGMYSLLSAIGSDDSVIAKRAYLLAIPPELGETRISSLRAIGLTDAQIATHPEFLIRMEETVQRCYHLLLSTGMTQSDILRNYKLLLKSPDFIFDIYTAFMGLDIAIDAIPKTPRLFYRSRKLLESRYRKLVELRINEKVIRENPELLLAPPENVKANFDFLFKIGLDYGQIVENVDLLCRSPMTLRKNYQHHVGLLREDYEDRSSGRKHIIAQPGLVGTNEAMVESNVQYLDSLGVNYLSSLLLITKPATKRLKIGWILREILGYRTALDEDKPKLLATAVGYASEHPSFLIHSIDYLESHNEELAISVGKYMELHNLVS